MKIDYKQKSYQEIKNLMESIQRQWCVKCREITFHIKRGFKMSNLRFECLKCMEIGR